MKALLCVRLANGEAVEVYPGFTVSEPIMKTVRVNVKLSKGMTGIFVQQQVAIAEFTFERVAEQQVATDTKVMGKTIYEVEPVALYWLSNTPPSGWRWTVHPEHKKFILSRSK